MTDARIKQYRLELLVKALSEYEGLHMIPDEQKDQRVCGDINNGLSTGPKMSPPLSRRPCSESHYAPDGRGKQCDTRAGS